MTGASSSRQAPAAKASQGPWRPGGRSVVRQSLLLVAKEERGGSVTKKSWKSRLRSTHSKGSSLGTLGVGNYNLHGEYG